MSVTETGGHPVRTREVPDDGPVGMKTRYKYIHFVEIPTSRKTSVWSCYNNRSGDELGQVRWYSRWRQYCYFPVAQAVYNVGCLNDIVHFITQLADQRVDAADQ